MLPPKKKSLPLALAACVAASSANADRPAPLAAANPPADGTTFVVTNCGDAGAGSLRDAVAAAPDGGTIDLAELACSTITLASGAIAIGQDELTIRGPGAAALTVDGNFAGRALQHGGSGTLHVEALGFAHGEAESGGCIASSGNLELDHVDLDGCSARSDANGAIVRGGGASADGNLALRDSRVHGCSAYALNGAARGGGLYAHGTLEITRSRVDGNDAVTMAPTGTLLPGGAYYAAALGGGANSYLSMTLGTSTISGNRARAPNNQGGDQANGGGLYVTYGSATIRDSTIDGNHADHIGGGAKFKHFGGSLTRITNSTISGNDAGVGGGGLHTQPWLTLVSSTVAFNRVSGTGIAGVQFGFDHRGTLRSSIVANNTAANGESDISVGSLSHIYGDHNLIRDGAEKLPDTITADPLLGPLRDNGGPTRTHALLSRSPAIDAGSNSAGLANDQRGSDHARVLGALADIGAFELDPADAIFSSGFDGGPAD